MDSVDALSPHPDVLDSFQTDMQFSPIQATSPEALDASGLVRQCIEAAGEVTRKVGMSGVDRVCATGKTKQLMIFGLNAKNRRTPGPRVFGMITRPDAQLEAIVNHVKDQI